MKKKIVLAYSGGLDTSYCAVWLREQGFEVHTVTALTDAHTRADLDALRQRALSLGATTHTSIDARRELFDGFLRFLIFGNVLRGEAYPLCVSVERVAQARCVAQHARRIGAAALAHGSTGAGNDQVRFDAAFGVYAPDTPVLTPIRSQTLSREQATEFLKTRGITLPPRTSRYSVNRGIWGATIGGAETHASNGILPEEAYVLTAGAADWPAAPEPVEIAFERGLPTALDGESLDPVRVIETLNGRAGRHGVGRGMHVGDTIIGIKGRVAFEAPAAVTLIAAHREIEKLVLSRQQQMWKRTLGDLYGGLLHEARYFDPLMRDLEAFLDSSQRRVSGTATVRLHRGQATVLGANAPASLMNPALARYGEGSRLWSGAEAEAFSKLYGLPDRLAAMAGAASGEGA